MHEVIQVIPQPDFTVYVYFDDGIIKKFDMKPLLNMGVFKKISNLKDFTEKCTVMNHTLAWDLSGNFDPYDCIDIDPDNIYIEAEQVADPLEKSPTGF